MTAVLASLETFHKTRLRPDGPVKTFSTVDRSKCVPYTVDTEDFASLLLQFGKAGHGFADGVHANASISQVAAGWKCSLAVGIYGTRGGVRWDLQQPNEIQVGHRDQPNQVLQRGTPGFDVEVAGFTDYPGGHPEGFPDSHKMHYRAIYQSLAGGSQSTPLYATVEDGHDEVRLCEAILRSARLRRWVSIPARRG